MLFHETPAIKIIFFTAHSIKLKGYTMNQKKQKEFILHGNIWKIMVSLSGPAILAMILYGLNTVFDAFFVGRFIGESALAGVSLAYPLTQLSLGLGSLIGVGAGSALSIALGANDLKTQERLLGNVNYLNLLFAAFFTLVGIIFSKSLIIMMGGTGQALTEGINYFRITLFGSIFWIAGLSGNMIIRAEGKMKTAAIMMAIGLLVNIIANYILIVVLKKGVEGAAHGTNLGMLVYTLSSLIYFSKKKASFESKPFAIYRDKNIVRSILSMGTPSLIMTVMSLIQAIVVLNALSHYGSNSDIAFYGIAFRLFTFMLTPIFGLMRALQPVIGINYGAGKNKRVIQSFNIFAIAATCLMIPFWLFIQISPNTLLQIMLPSRTFTAQDLLNFKFFLGLLPFLPIIFMAMTFFPAINKSKPASIMGIARQLLFYVPVMLILPKYFGINWVYYGSFGIDLIIIIWVFFMIKSEFKILSKPAL